jgi:hypothetical protein
MRNCRHIERSVIAIAGSIAVVLVGVGIASVLGVNDWIGIVIVVLTFGVVIGSVGVREAVSNG